MHAYASFGLLAELGVQGEPSWLAPVRSSFLPVAYGILLVTLIGIVIVLAYALFRALQSGDVPKVESWDGFGGGLGGWQMSRSLALLIAAALFSSVAAVTVRSAANDLKSEPSTSVAPDSTKLLNGATGQTAASDSTKAKADSTQHQTTSRQ